MSPTYWLRLSDPRLLVGLYAGQVVLHLCDFVVNGWAWGLLVAALFSAFIVDLVRHSQGDAR